MSIPRALAEEWRREPHWLARLPRLAAECAERWQLVLEEPFDTPHSLVVPAGEAVLKLNAPSHFEADHEADALEGWAGKGAVQLLALADARRAFLVERCRPGTPLWEAEADESASSRSFSRGCRSTYNSRSPSGSSRTKQGVGPRRFRARLLEDELER